MQKDVRSIPPAPRSVRMRPLLAHRWPLLFGGSAMVVLGSLIAWLMFLQSSARLSYGPRLAAGPTTRVTGNVVSVGNVTRFDGNDWQAIGYEFRWPSQQQEVTVSELGFAPAGRYRIGDTASIDVLTEDANVSCVVGGVAHMHRSWLYPRFWLGAMVVPGALTLLGWLSGLFQLRQVLVHGDVSVGRVVEVQPVPWILPEMLRVSYEFRDHRATIRRNRHWVRARGALGSRLKRGEHGDALPVLHDRRLPQWNRMLLPADFLHTPVEDPQLPIT